MAAGRLLRRLTEEICSVNSICFLDVGAYKGRTSQLLLWEERKNPFIRSYMFEPNPILAARLRIKFEDEHRAIVHEAALTDFNGVGKMYWDESTGEGASLYSDKKTSIGAPTIDVACMDVHKFVESLQCDRIVLYSNCEGSEFEILDALFDSGLWKRINLWSIAFHHGDRKIPSMKPKFERLSAKMEELGIENVPGHFGKKDIKEGKLESFIMKVQCLKYE